MVRYRHYIRSENGKELCNMSYTVCCEIENSNVPYQGIYFPAVDGFKAIAYKPQNVDKAIRKVIKFAWSNSYVDKVKIVIYEGQYDYYKNNKIIFESPVMDRREFTL